MHVIKVGRQAGLGQEQWQRAGRGREGAMHLIPKLYSWRHQASADCIHYGEGDRSWRCFGSAWTSRSLRLNPDWLDRITSENILWTLGQKADGVLSP